MISKFLTLLVVCVFMTSAAESRCRGKDIFSRSSPEFQIAVEKAAKKHPYHTGVYWKISKGDKTSWLIGTIHISDTRVSRIPDYFKKKIGAARLVLVESTERQGAEFTSKFLRPPSKERAQKTTSLSEAWAKFSPQEQKLLEREARSKNFSIAIMKLYPLGILSLLIDQPKCDKNNKRYLDAYIEKAAKKARIPVSGLDDVDMLIKVMTSSNLDDATYIDYVKRELPRLKFRRHMLETMVQMYLKGEIVKFAEFSRARMHSYLPPRTVRLLERDTFQKLIVARNKFWMKRLVGEMRKGNVVVAVGAGHLNGTNGLLNLLRQQGFAIERLGI